MQDLLCSAESLFRNVTKIINPTGIFYVGAYLGNELEIFQKYECPVYSFEPNPFFAETIKEKYNRLNIKGNFYQAGVGNFCGSLPLKIPDNDQIASSFLKPSGIKQIFKHMVLNKEVLAEIITIDSLNISNANYMVLDIQGMEFNALLGAYSTVLNHVDVIIVEYSSVELYSNQNTILDLNLLLSELGFICKSNLTYMHGDALFIKNRFLDRFENLPNITHCIVDKNGAYTALDANYYNNEWSLS